MTGCTPRFAIQKYNDEINESLWRRPQTVSTGGEAAMQSGFSSASPDTDGYPLLPHPHSQFALLQSRRLASPNQSLLFDLLADQLLVEPDHRRLVRASFPYSSSEDLCNLHSVIWAVELTCSGRTRALQHALTLYMNYQPPGDLTSQQSWPASFSRYSGKHMLPLFLEAQVRLLIALDFGLNNQISDYCFEIASLTRSHLWMDPLLIITSDIASCAAQRLQSEALFASLYDLITCFEVQLDPRDKLRTLLAVGDIHAAMAHAIQCGGEVLCMLAEELVLRGDRLVCAAELGSALKIMDVADSCNYGNSKLALLYTHLCARMRRVPQMCDFLFIVCLEAGDYARVLRLYDIFICSQNTETASRPDEITRLHPANLQAISQAVALLPARLRLTPRQLEQLEQLEATGDPTREPPQFEFLPSQNVCSSPQSDPVDTISSNTTNVIHDAILLQVVGQAPRKLATSGSSRLAPFAASRELVTRQTVQQMADENTLEYRMRDVQLANEMAWRDDAESKLSLCVSVDEVAIEETPSNSGKIRRRKGLKTAAMEQVDRSSSLPSSPFLGPEAKRQRVSMPHDIKPRLQSRARTRAQAKAADSSSTTVTLHTAGQDKTPRPSSRTRVPRSPSPEFVPYVAEVSESDDSDDVGDKVMEDEENVNNTEDISTPTVFQRRQGRRIAAVTRRSKRLQAQETTANQIS